MDCSAILVNYLGADETTKAVEAVRDDNPSIEVMVVDNSVCDREFARLKNQLPKDVRLLQAEQNLGFGVACNRAFDLTTSPYVLLVNPDVRVLRGCIEELVKVLDRDVRVGAVAPRQYLDDGCQWGLPPSWFPTHLRAWTTELGLRDRRHARRLSLALRAESIRYWTAKQGVTQRALSGGVVMIRRSTIETDMGLFDPRFFMYFEDSDLCARLKRQGFRLEVAPDAKAVHQWRNLPHKAGLMARGAQLFFDKYGAGKQRWVEKARVAQMRPILSPLLRETSPFPISGMVVPGAWENGWLLELSPSPLLSPAIGRLGAGCLVEYPKEVLPNFAGTAVYGRLGPISIDSAPDDYVYFEFSAGADTGAICEN